MTEQVLGGAAKRALIADMPSPHDMDDDALIHELNELIAADKRSARRWACPRPDCDGLPHRGWRHRHARASQRLPDWAWTTWLMMTGRGWGKTRTAAEGVKEWAKQPNQFIAVLAKNDTLMREICFEHRTSGLLAIIPPASEDPVNGYIHYGKSAGSVHMMLANGTYIRGFSAEVPDNLRGWAFDKAWADEFAAWSRKSAQETMDMIWFCLREAAEPQVIISTTPKPLPHVKKLVTRHRSQVAKLQEQHAAGDQSDVDALVHPRVVLTTGSTDENSANLSSVALETLHDDFDSTRQGAQELDGELLEDIDGALWRQWVFDTDDFRVERHLVPDIERKVIAVDPAVTNTETADESGIAVMGRSYWRGREVKDPRPRLYLFRSETLRGTPIQTMSRVAQLYHEEECDAVVIEANNGGDYLPTTLMMVDPTVQWRIVHATRDKRARATPVANLYEQQRAHHVYDPEKVDEHGVLMSPARQFDAIETTMVSYVGAPETDEKSPDDLDALVWAAWDLFLDPTNVAPPPKWKRGSDDEVDQRLQGRR